MAVAADCVLNVGTVGPYVYRGVHGLLASLYVAHVAERS